MTPWSETVRGSLHSGLVALGAIHLADLWSQHGVPMLVSIPLLVLVALWSMPGGRP